MKPTKKIQTDTLLYSLSLSLKPTQKKSMPPKKAAGSKHEREDDTAHDPKAKAEAERLKRIAEDPLRIRCSDKTQTKRPLTISRLINEILQDLVWGQRMDWKVLRQRLEQRDAKSPAWFMRASADEIGVPKPGSGPNSVPDILKIQHVVVAEAAAETLAPTTFVIRQHRLHADDEDNMPERVCKMEDYGFFWVEVVADDERSINCWLLSTKAEVQDRVGEKMNFGFGISRATTAVAPAASTNPNADFARDFSAGFISNNNSNNTTLNRDFSAGFLPSTSAAPAAAATTLSSSSTAGAFAGFGAASPSNTSAGFAGFSTTSFVGFTTPAAAASTTTAGDNSLTRATGSFGSFGAVNAAAATTTATAQPLQTFGSFGGFGAASPSASNSNNNNNNKSSASSAASAPVVAAAAAAAVPPPPVVSGVPDKSADCMFRIWDRDTINEFKAGLKSGSKIKLVNIELPQKTEEEEDKKENEDGNEDAAADADKEKESSNSGSDNGDDDDDDDDDASSTDSGLKVFDKLIMQNDYKDKVSDAVKESIDRAFSKKCEVMRDIDKWLSECPIMETKLTDKLEVFRQAVLKYEKEEGDDWEEYDKLNRHRDFLKKKLDEVVKQRRQQIDAEIAILETARKDITQGCMLPMVDGSGDKKWRMLKFYPANDKVPFRPHGKASGLTQPGEELDECVPPAYQRQQTGAFFKQ